MNEIEPIKKEYQAPKTNILGTIGRWLLIICTAIVLIIAAIFYFSYRAITNASADIDVNSSIDVTPTQIESMKQIGEWEFLSISDEEMIDTLRRASSATTSSSASTTARSAWASTCTRQSPTSSKWRKTRSS